jgi:aminoglycoside 6-adenylyltransferase
MLNYDDLIHRITTWVVNTADLRAALLLGSRARTDHPADEWSDLDVLVFAVDPEQFIQSSEWVKTIAPTWLTFFERAGDGVNWERRSLFAGGLDVDVAFIPAEWLDGIHDNIPPTMVDIIRRGVKLLVDKDGKLGNILNKPLPEASPFERPTQPAFINAVSDFWYHTLWSAKHLRRGELWWAKSCVDNYLKGLLQQMLEWHAHAVNGDRYDTWMRGRFLEEWADPRALAQMKDIFSHYEARDIARALSTTMDLYRWLEDETTAKWGISIPREGEQQAAAATLKLIEPFGVDNPPVP